MAQKRKTTKKGGAAHAKSRSNAPQKQQVSQSARNQTAAVLLFAGAILLLCIALIPGESLWGWLHRTEAGIPKVRQAA